MKKLISIMLSLALVVSSFAISSTAFAEEGKSANVFLSAVYCGDNLFDPVTVDVSADLDKTYDVGYTDDSEEPTILDAIIAMHIETFGEEDFALAPQEYFSVINNGWAMIVKAFGDDGSMCSYYHNGNYASGITEELADGDYIEFTMRYTDNYAYFNTRSAKASLVDPLNLTVCYDAFPASGIKASNASVYVDGDYYGSTDANGEINIKFESIGKHIVTAKGDNLMVPYCEVTVANHLADYMDAQLASGVDYVVKNGYMYSANSLGDLTNLVAFYEANPAVFADEIEDALLQAKDNMDTNDGKLIYSVDYMGTLDEDLAAYGALIQLVNINGDANDFYGYNLYELMESLPADKVSSPYNYRFAIDNARDKFKIAICDSFVKNYYTLGKGMNYWGYSCDNTAMFIVAMATAPSQFDKYVDDALSVMKSYITSKGAGYSTEFPDENADSTATALMAYASVGNYTNALKMYTCLVKNFQSSTKGVMLVKRNDKMQKDAYATRDAIYGISRFNMFVKANNKDAHITKNTVTKATTSKSGKSVDTCIICGKETKSTKISYIKSVKLSSTSYTYNGKAKKPTVKVYNGAGNVISSSNYTVTYSNNTKVGKASVKVIFKNNYSGTVTKTFKINPANTSNLKVSALSKGFKATWNKKSASEVTGYQIRYATKFDMSNAKYKLMQSSKTTSKTVKDLSAKKKYRVQIRTYKTVNGTRYYSSWSDPKYVTTKN